MWGPMFYEGGPKQKWNYLLEDKPVVWYRLPQLGECSRNPCVSVYQLALLWEAAFSFSDFFFEDSLKEFVHLMMCDLWSHLPTPCWVFSSFWPKNARTLVPHPPYSPNLTPIDYFCCGFPEWKVLTGKRFASVEGVKQKTAEALKGIKIDEFKNCFEHWKKGLDSHTASNGEYFEGDWSLNI